MQKACLRARTELAKRVIIHKTNGGKHRKVLQLLSIGWLVLVPVAVLQDSAFMCVHLAVVYQTLSTEGGGVLSRQMRVLSS